MGAFKFAKTMAHQQKLEEIKRIEMTAHKHTYDPPKINNDLAFIVRRIFCMRKMNVENE